MHHTGNLERKNTILSEHVLAAVIYRLYSEFTEMFLFENKRNIHLYWVLALTNSSLSKCNQKPAWSNSSTRNLETIFPSRFRGKVGTLNFPIVLKNQKILVDCFGNPIHTLSSLVERMLTIIKINYY